MFGLPNQDSTDITVLLDRSGSMQAVQHATVDGFAAFLDKQRRCPGVCRLTLCQFDTVYEVVYRNKPLRKVGPLVLQPRGSTALLDAMGRTIHDTALRLEQARPAQLPARIIMVIVTDGLENSSHEFTRSQVFDLVRHYKEREDWQFVFLGANQDAIQEAGRMGIDAGAAMTYAAGIRGTDAAWRGMSEAVARHRQCGSKRMAGSYFRDSERDAARQAD